MNLFPLETDHHDITVILLKVALNTITPNPYKDMKINIPFSFILL
jgi:hypothetical protein